MKNVSKPTDLISYRKLKESELTYLKAYVCYLTDCIHSAFFSNTQIFIFRKARRGKNKEIEKVKRAITLLDK